MKKLTKYIKAKTYFNGNIELYKYKDEFQFVSYDNYVVQSQFGDTIGKILPDAIPLALKDNPIKEPQYNILRKAKKIDLETYDKCLQKSLDAFPIVKKKIQKYNLPMKLISTHFFLDNNKALFNFSANLRIDFRELVRDLASVFKTRIELRQIGPRNESMLLGGYGICGKELCCTKRNIQGNAVSIQMAKEQNLNLNSFKISGLCGKLMCCINYELSSYNSNSIAATKENSNNHCNNNTTENEESFERCTNCVNTFCAHYFESKQN